MFNKEQYGISNIRKARYSSNKAYLIIYSRAYIQIWNSTNLYLMHELHFDEAIQSVLCTSQKLYIAFLNGYFRVFELNSWKLLYENTNLRKQRFFISPKQKFLIAQNYTGDFELYDIHSFEYIRSFNGDFFAFNDSETRIIIGHNYTKFREERITDHTILTEWTLDITTVSDKYIYTFEIVNIITEDIIIEMLRDKGFIVENVTYFFVVDLRYLPDSNKLIIYFTLDELNETIDETAAEAKNKAIASFYTSMNSDAYGHLLDSIELVDRRLAALKENKVKIPPQLLPLTIVFKQLLNFIKDSGIEPIDTTGRQFSTEAENLAEYTYIGEPFHYADEKKDVVVEKPGWKYEDTIISLPTVREKEE